MIEIQDFVELVSTDNRSSEVYESYVRYSMLNTYCQLELDRLKMKYKAPSSQQVSDAISLGEDEIDWLSCGNLNRKDFVLLAAKILSSDYFKGKSSDSRPVDKPKGEHCCNHFQCGESKRLEKDHIIPYSVLKNSEPWNVQWLCKRHNLLKGNRIELFALDDEGFRNGLKDFLEKI